ncbi:MAG: PIN domain-containing protein [Caldilinea sp. CFX5]|nr:PIN domain-containing protein [Caldilinea sp. CFX5]
MIAIADTGFVLAVAVTTDQRHAECLTAYRQYKRIYLPQSTLAEVAYLITRNGGNAATAYFLHGLSRTKYQLVPLEAVDVIRTAQLLLQFADARIDFVDITIAAVAERLNITRILTIDHRDFRLLRPVHCPYFELLP